MLAQRAAETEGGELAVIPELLDGLDLEGCLVSLDALACQPGIAERIVAQGGDYLLALKGNRKKAHAEVEAWFAANAFALGASLRPCFDAFDDGHGRLVRRRVFACTELGAFGTLADWPGLATVLAIETIRGIPGRGKVTADIRHYLSSAALPPEALAVAIRRHWAVENGLHWVLEVVFAQMTKPHALALRAGGQHVADLDVGIGDDHAVDEQQHELAPLLKAGPSQAAPHACAEGLERRRHPCELLLARCIAA